MRPKVAEGPVGSLGVKPPLIRDVARKARDERKLGAIDDAEDPTPFLRRWTMWAAVRWVAVKEPGERADLWKDVWRILPITIVALPIIAPAATAIATAIPVFYLLERILYAVLLVAQRTQRRQGRQTKRVNEPQLRWKL